MRVKEEFKKSGYFWLPSTPNHKVPGTLSISDGSDIELEIVGLIEDEKKFDSIFNFERVIGHIEKEGLITLEKCRYKNKNYSFGGISKSLLLINTAFIGVAYEENKIPTFNTCIFSVEGIDEWVGMTGITVDSHFEKDSISTITYTPCNDIDFELSDGIKLSICFSWQLPGFPILKEAKISQKTYLKLVSEKEHELGDLKSLVSKITTFLCFAIDKIISIDSVTAFSDNLQQSLGEDKSIHIPIKIYSSSYPYSENIPKIDWDTMLFTYEDIKANAEIIINNWIGAYDEIEPAMNLYFSTKTGGQKYIEGKFLALAQVLETYHRRKSTEKLMDDDLFDELKILVKDAVSKCSTEKQKEWLNSKLNNGNEPYLARRLELIIEPFKDFIGNDEEIKLLIKDIKNARNYLTHYDKGLEKKAVKGLELYCLYLKMEAIFQLHFLEMLGFTKAEIQSIFYRNYELRNKLGITK
jgi:hypothetical protein